MSESERVRERERPPLGDNPYERIMRQRRSWLSATLTGRWSSAVRIGKHQTCQGKLRYLHLEPVTFGRYAVQHWRVFMHDIRTRSGSTATRAAW